MNSIWAVMRLALLPALGNFAAPATREQKPVRRDGNKVTSGTAFCPAMRHSRRRCATAAIDLGVERAMDVTD